MVTLISADHVSCKYTQLAQCQCYSNSWFSSQESVRLPRFGSAAQGLQVPSSDLNAVIYLELSDGDAATLVPLFVKYLTNLFPGATDHATSVDSTAETYVEAAAETWQRRACRCHRRT